MGPVAGTDPCRRPGRYFFLEARFEFDTRIAAAVSLTTISPAQVKTRSIFLLASIRPTTLIPRTHTAVEPRHCRKRAAPAAIRNSFCMEANQRDHVGQTDEQRYRHLFEHVPICIFVIDLTSPPAILEANRRAELVYGYPTARTDGDAGQPILCPKRTCRSSRPSCSGCSRGQTVTAEIDQSASGRHALSRARDRRARSDGCGPYDRHG